MVLSDLSIRRPVLAIVSSLLLIVCGIAAFLNQFVPLLTCRRRRAFSVFLAEGALNR